MLPCNALALPHPSPAQAGLQAVASAVHAGLDAGMRSAARLVRGRKSGTVSATMPDQGMDASSDESLLTRHRDGDPDAFRTLVERYRRDLHGFLARFLGSSAAADDVFQDTMLQVHLSADSFDAERRFKPWLFTIAANKARDFHRRSKHRRAVSLDKPIGKDDSSTMGELVEARDEAPEARASSRDESALVKQVLDNMPEHHREVILLGYFQRLSYQQVADALGVPLGTIKSRMHAAVAMFSTQWRRRTRSGSDPAHDSGTGEGPQ
ncbi:MAG: RNA polymerase sigma factor [Planctomycetes bacterium]|nr:RNA polymerase sigma factor [Planctomycetota bacterium]